MKELLEKLEGLRKPINQDHVAYLIKQLGESPSIATIEEVLKFYKEVQRKILAVDLLEWMNENDMINLETDDLKIKIQTYVSTKIADEDAAFDWLNANEYGDLIKTSVDFPKGEFTDEIQELLKGQGASYIRKDGIHAQTLKKVMSDRLKANESLPDEDQGFTINYHDECAVKEK